MMPEAPFIIGTFFLCVIAGMMLMFHFDNQK